MKRFALTISLIAVAAGLLVTAPSAFAIKAGFNLATKRLEAAYKVALFERRFSDDGCYPAPPQLAKAIHGVQPSARSAWPPTPSTSPTSTRSTCSSRAPTCDHLRMALRAVGGIYVLDSKLGTVRLQGHKGAATPGLAKPITNLTLATKTFHVTQPDTAPRLQTICPGGRFPLGGGMSQSPADRQRRRGRSIRTPTSGSAPSAAGTSASSSSTPAAPAPPRATSPCRRCAGSA